MYHLDAAARSRVSKSRPRLVYWLSNHWLHLGIVLALAGMLRFANLATLPQGIFHDEAWSGAKALNILNGAAPAQVYFPENNGMDALHVYLIALLFKFTGPVALGRPYLPAANNPRLMVPQMPSFPGGTDCAIYARPIDPRQL